MTFCFEWGPRFHLRILTHKPSTVLGAVDDLLLRMGAAFPSSDPHDMHVYATKAPSQPFLREILDVTQSMSNALVTMLPVGDSKVISLLKEHATHDQVVFEGHHWIEDIPLDPKLRPDFILFGVEKWAKGAKMEVSPNHTDNPTSDPQPNIDIPINLLRRFVAQYPTPPGITTCNLIIVSSSQPNSGLMHHSPSSVPYFPLLGVPSVPSQSHAFPLPGGDSSWVLDFGAKGLIMRRSAMQALVQALGHVSDIDVTLSGMGFMNLGMGLMNEDNPGWVSMLLQKRSRILAEHLYTTQNSPNQLFPPIHLTLRVPNEAGFVLGRVRVRNMAEVWATLEIVREQCWLNNIVASYVWEDTPPQHTEAPEAAGTGLANLLSGKFLSIPTQMNISTGSTHLSLLLQFPIPSKGGVPSVVQFMVSYDPTATRGTRIQFGTLESKLPVTETLGRFEDQVDEVVRRAGPLAAVGWLHAQLKTS
ncbi:hypothetical protein RSAG8_07480, partial [Rhizoctonia solani AG-8 WAC10335]